MSDDSLATGAPAAAPVARASMRRNIAHMTSSQVFTWVIATMTSVVVPRYLGPETQGRLQLANSFWMLAAVFTALGTATYLQLALSRDEQHGLQLVAPVVVVRTAAFVVAAAVIGLYAANSDNGPNFGAMVAVGGVVALFSLYSDVFSSGFMGLENMSTLARVSAAMRVVGFVCVLSVLLIGAGVFGVLGVQAAVGLTTLVVLATRFRRLAAIPLTGWTSHLRTVLVASVPFMAIDLALAAYRQVDVIVISQIASSRDIGWYSTADVLAGSLLFPTTVILTSAFPTFGRLHAQDPARLRELVRQAFSLLLVVSVPIGVGAAVVGPTFAPLLYGDKYQGTGAALVIFGPVTILTFGTTLMANVAVATGRKRFVALLLAGVAVLTIPLDLLLVPWAVDRYDNGAIGGALAYVVTETLQFVLGLVVVTRYLVTRQWVFRCLRVLAAGGIMLLTVLPFRDEFFLVPAAIGFLVYPLAVILLNVLDEDERAMVGNVARRLGVDNPWAR